MCNPINKIPNPATISPNILSGLFLERRGIAPTNAKNAKYGVKLNDDKETINVVIVVPTFAPIIHAQAWNNVIVPTSASLTNVTVVTSEDWTRAQCKKPAPNPANLLGALNPLVKKLLLDNEACTKPLDIKFMPTRKQPHAVKTSMTAVTVFNGVANVTKNILSSYSIIFCLRYLFSLVLFWLRQMHQLQHEHL